VGDSKLLAGSLALDLLRAHLPAIEAAPTVVDARAALAQPIAEAREVFTRMSGQADADALEQHLDELLARLVVLRQPRIDANGRIYDAGTPSRAGPIVAIAIVLVLAVGITVVALLLVGR
jgi:hypothetical protein